MVRVPVKLLKASEPKSRSWSLNSDAGLTTLTEVWAAIERGGGGGRGQRGGGERGQERE